MKEIETDNKKNNPSQKMFCIFSFALSLFLAIYNTKKV